MTNAISSALAEAQKKPFHVRKGAMGFAVQQYSEACSGKVIAAATSQPGAAITIGGGCKNLSISPEGMMEYFAQAFEGNFSGCLLGGATRSVGNDAINWMVTDIPGTIAKHSDKVVAIGTAPKTTDLFQLDERGVKVSEYDYINPDFDMVILTQADPFSPMQTADGEADWGGDLKLRGNILETLSTYNNRPCGGIYANGGGVTVDEIKQLAKLELPIILIKGTERAADEGIQAYKDENWEWFGVKKQPKLFIADIQDYKSLTTAIEDAGLAVH